MDGEIGATCDLEIVLANSSLAVGKGDDAQDGLKSTRQAMRMQGTGSMNIKMGMQVDREDNAPSYLRNRIPSVHRNCRHPMC